MAANIYPLQLLVGVNKSEEPALRGLTSLLKCLCYFPSPVWWGYIISIPIFCLSKRHTKMHVIQFLSRENTLERAQTIPAGIKHC